MRPLVNMLTQIHRRGDGHGGTHPAREREADQSQLLSAVEDARAEWINAQAYFDCVSDPDLVDHAVYLMGAAERKYMHLIKKAREDGLTLFSGSG